MKQLLFFPLLFLMLSVNVIAQDETTIIDTSWKTNYRGFATKENDLVHTKLVAGFNYAKSQLNGEVWLQLHPHFYAINTVTLDAKGMDLLEVAMVKNNVLKKLTYSYDSLLLHITLDKTYKASENYTIYIKYIAKPNDYQAKGSAAITDPRRNRRNFCLDTHN